MADAFSRTGFPSTCFAFSEILKINFGNPYSMDSTCTPVIDSFTQNTSNYSRPKCTPLVHEANRSVFLSSEMYGDAKLLHPLNCSVHRLVIKFIYKIRYFKLPLKLRN